MNNDAFDGIYACYYYKNKDCVLLAVIYYVARPNTVILSKTFRLAILFLYGQSQTNIDLRLCDTRMYEFVI